MNQHTLHLHTDKLYIYTNITHMLHTYMYMQTHTDTDINLLGSSALQRILFPSAASLALVVWERMRWREGEKERESERVSDRESEERRGGGGKERCIQDHKNVTKPQYCKLTNKSGEMSRAVNCTLANRHQMVNTAISHAYTFSGRLNCSVWLTMLPARYGKASLSLNVREKE